MYLDGLQNIGFHLLRLGLLDQGQKGREGWRRSSSAVFGGEQFALRQKKYKSWLLLILTLTLSRGLEASTTPASRSTSTTQVISVRSVCAKSSETGSSATPPTSASSSPSPERSSRGRQDRPQGQGPRHRPRRQGHLQVIRQHDRSPSPLSSRPSSSPISRRRRSSLLVERAFFVHKQNYN